MQTNEDIRKEWNKTQFTNDIWKDKDCVDVKQDEIADWWLNKINLQKQQMIEKGGELEKTHTTHSKSPCQECIKEYGYNMAITDYQNLINKEI